MDRYVVVERAWNEDGEPVSWGIYDTVKMVDDGNVRFSTRSTADSSCGSMNFRNGVGRGNMSRGYNRCD